MGSSSTTTTTSGSKKSHPPSHHQTKSKLDATSTAAKQLPLLGLNRYFVMTKWHILLGCICLAVATYCGYVGYLETRVNTPFDDHKVQYTQIIILFKMNNIYGIKIFVIRLSAMRVWRTRSATGAPIDRATTLA